MAPKKRGKKAAKDPAHAQKLDFLAAEFESNVEMEYLSMQEDICSGSDEISKLYDQALAAIDPQYLDMTLNQIQEIGMKTPTKKGMSRLSKIQSKLKNAQEKHTLSVNRQLSRPRTVLNKTLNKTIGQNTSIRGSILKNTSIRGSTMNTKMKRKILSSVQQTSTPLRRQMLNQIITPGIGTVGSLPKKRKMFESSTTTPVPAKRVAREGSPKSKGVAKNNKLTVTPKFDPRTPLNRINLRKPKRDEVIMSMSGSPLQNAFLQMPEKPSLLLSFGDGRIVDVTDKSQLMALKTTSINEETKSHLLLAQRTLAGILQK